MYRFVFFFRLFPFLFDFMDMNMVGKSMIMCGLGDMVDSGIFLVAKLYF